MADNDHQLVVRMPPELLAQIRSAAAEDERTVSQQVRHVLRAYLDAKHPPT